MIKTLEFTNPIFHKGKNLTVRKGRKWLLETEAKIDGKLYEIHTRLVIFFELKDSDLMDEHDPACRTVDGLFEVLRVVYPDITRNSEVTLVTFLYET